MKEFKLEYRRLLIVRLSALGDTALTLPLAWALREALPEAHIGWVVEEPASALLKTVSEIDRVHIWKKSEKTLRGLLRLCREIRDEDYDTAFDTQGLTKSALIPFLSHVPRRIGLVRDTVEGRELSPILNNLLVRPPKDVTDITSRTLHLLNALDLPVPQQPSGQLTPDRDAAKQIEQWRHSTLPDRPLFLFGVGAGWPTKVWPVERVAVLAERVAEKGMQPVVLWGPSEEKCLSEWAAHFSDWTHFAPPTNVPEMVALIDQSVALAAPDTAALHLAALLGKPTFSWFAASDPARCAPVGPHHACVSIGTPTWSRTFQGVRKDDIRQLSLEAVLPVFDRWLSESCPL